MFVVSLSWTLRGPLVHVGFKVEIESSFLTLETPVDKTNSPFSSCCTVKEGRLRKIV